MRKRERHPAHGPAASWLDGYDARAELDDRDRAEHLADYAEYLSGLHSAESQEQALPGKVGNGLPKRGIAS